jgi:hypothetical protein
LVIDLAASPLPFVKSFQLSLAKSTGSGGWELRDYCPVCDLFVSPPNATATITSYSFVPEPGTVAIALMGAACCVGRWRPRKRFVE